MDDQLKLIKTFQLGQKQVIQLFIYTPSQG